MPAVVPLQRQPLRFFFTLLLYIYVLFHFFNIMCAITFFINIIIITIIITKAIKLLKKYPTGLPWWHSG